MDRNEEIDELERRPALNKIVLGKNPPRKFPHISKEQIGADLKELAVENRSRFCNRTFVPK